MPVALAPKGMKRVCMNCGARFFDMNKRPIVCPSCHTEFTGDTKVRVRRARVAAVEETKVVANDVVEDDTPIIENDDVVSLEEVESDIDTDDDIDDLDDDDIDDDIDDEDDED